LQNSRQAGGQLQTVSKLLRMIYRKSRKENQILPQICASKNLPLINTDNTDLKKLKEKPNLTTQARRHREQPKNLPLINTDDTDLRKKRRPESDWAANERETTRIALGRDTGDRGETRLGARAA
jgi:hypothetical protein